LSAKKDFVKKSKTRFLDFFNTTGSELPSGGAERSAISVQNECQLPGFRSAEFAKAENV